MMISIKLTCTAALLSVAVCAPAYAQMSSGSQMKMSGKDSKMMSKCSAMPHDMMMKNKGCMKMMKMHPDMMKGG